MPKKTKTDWKVPPIRYQRANDLPPLTTEGTRRTVGYVMVALGIGVAVFAAILYILR